MTGNRKKPKPAPRWLTGRGIRVDLSAMPDRHLQNTERYLRGGGKAPSPLQRGPLTAIQQAVADSYGDALRKGTEEWHGMIRAELERRGLPLLPDHDAALERSPIEAPETHHDVRSGQIIDIRGRLHQKGESNA